MRERIPDAQQAQEADGKKSAPSEKALARTALQLQRSVGNRATARLLQRSAASPYMRFSVAVDRPMGSEDLLVEFAVQTRRRENFTRAQAKEGIRDQKIYWVDGAGNRISTTHRDAPKVTPDEAKQGYKLLMVYAHGVTPLSDREFEARRKEFYALGDAEEDAINKQTNELFWESTGYKVGQKLDPENNPDDRKMAEEWLRLRAQVVGQRHGYLNMAPDLRKMLHDMIPPDARPYMFAAGGTAVLKPTDFGAALRIADLLAQLTPEERAEYYARVRGTTDSWKEFERSLETFNEERELHRKAASRRETAKGELAAYERLYFAWTAYKDKAARAARSRGGALPVFEEYAALEKEAEAHGFETVQAAIAYLEPRVGEFRRAFEKEARLVTEDVLHRFRRLLWHEQERLTNGIELAQFYGAIKGAEGDLESIADEWPLLRDEELRDRLEGSWSASEAFDRVHFYVKQRRESIDRAAREVREDPELIYAFDVLLAHALARAGAAEGSMFREIVMRHKADIDFREMIKNVGFLVLTIAVGLLTRGALGALGATASAGLGVYDALEEFRKYEVAEAGHEAGLASESPSSFWLIMSAMGAVGDAAAAVRIVSRLGDAAHGFARTRNLQELDAAYERAIAKAFAAGDHETVKLLRDTKDEILAAAAKRARTLDEEVDDAFRPIDEGPLGKVEPDFSYQTKPRPPEPAWREVRETPLVREAVEAEFRIPVANQARFQAFAEKYGVEIFVRPTSPESLAHIKRGDDLMKPEDIKVKTFSEIDVYLGAPKAAVGKVGFFKPKPPDLSKIPADKHNEVIERFAFRDAEYWTEARKMNELQKDLLDQMGTNLEYRIHIDEGGVISDAKTGRTFTGDHDVYEIRRADGSRLSDAEYRMIVADMQDSGLIQHGAHLRWEPKTASEWEIYDAIVQKHESGREGLVRFAKGAEPRRAAAPMRQW